MGIIPDHSRGVRNGDLRRALLGAITWLGAIAKWHSHACGSIGNSGEPFPPPPPAVPPSIAGILASALTAGHFPDVGNATAIPGNVTNSCDPDFVVVLDDVDASEVPASDIREKGTLLGTGHSSQVLAESECPSMDTPAGKASRGGQGDRESAIGGTDSDPRGVPCA